MFEAKHRAVEKKESSTETDEGLGSSSKHFGSGSLGSGSGGSVYLSDSQDWVVSPSCSPDEGPAPHDEGPAPHAAISPMLAEETFRYMILSADRVEQMTKTYNDIDVVSHLLAERDRDLELAARIGQSLLQRNHLLQERNESIEEQLAQALDQVHQLQHELGKKDELLRMVASASEESETDSSVSTPLRQNPPLAAVATATAALSQLEHLQNKLQELEEENLALRSEACQLKRDTISYEEKEQQLVSDCVKELRESNSQMVTLTEDLSKKNEELLRHQEEIAQLLSQIVELQHRVKELALEKEELRIHLQASKDAQRQLTAELKEVTERNTECVEMLHESQEEIKELRNKNSPFCGMRRHMSYGLYPMDSLAAEIEGTMRRELSIDEETAFEDQRLSQKRVFQTVRSLNAAASSRAPSAGAPIPGSGSSLVMTAQPFPSTQGDEVKIGQPGCPGGNDLTKALHRLSLRRQNFLCERQFFQAEREKKLQALTAGGDGEASCCSSPMGSVMSSYSNLSELSFSSSVFKTFLPEKLQIVKPMEGSLTLHHWQQLAKPHLATILDPHPGVVTKGFRPLAQDAVYRLSDMEEDEDAMGRSALEKGATEQGKKEDEEEAAGRSALEKGATEQGEEEAAGRSALEKGATEQGKEEEDDEGITFRVRCTSTPDERRERRPLTSPLSPSLTTNPLTTTAAASVQADNQSAASIPGSSAAAGQSNDKTTATASSVQNPGKCQSSTFSTYTFTTCRILHPSDITQVTPSSQSSLVNTPSSMRTGPSTPVTPCRLSLGDSFPPRRPLAPPAGSLAKLVLERGISAQISTETPPPSPKPKSRPPLLRLLPVTPLNSPSQSPVPSPLPGERPADHFLASRPAELFLQDVYGLNLGRAPHPNLPSPSQDVPPPAAPQPDQGGIVERLRRLGFTRVLQGEASRVPPGEASTFVSAGGGSLLDGLRRNQSLPALIGAKPGGPHPPAHPTSLAIPPPPWGNLKEKRRQLASRSPNTKS